MKIHKINNWYLIIHNFFLGTLQLLQFPTHVQRSLRIFFRNESSFVPKKILIVAKLSRYHFERLQEPDLSEAQLKMKLIERGSDYDNMFASHLANKAIENQVIHLLEKMNVEYKIVDRFYANERFENKHSLPKERRLPWLALNEVFMGEILSARTSSLFIKFDEEQEYHKIKGSGLCVSTGTGSTSWHKSIHSLNHQTVREILNLIDIERPFTNEEIDMICSTFNSSLRFDAGQYVRYVNNKKKYDIDMMLFLFTGDSKLCYSIRDMIMTNAIPVSKDVHTRGFCRKAIVKSQCFDAGLVLDGGIAVPFNFGTIAEIETFPEDSLRTIVLLD
ncbi:NAKD2 kinase, partial [Acromyrmex insinuator]